MPSSGPRGRVPDVSRKLALAVAAALGTVAAVFVRLRGAPAAVRASSTEPGIEELRRKLAEARATGADEADFEAAGMGPETILEEKEDASRGTPGDDVEAARRRVHEEARATAEEMRRAGEADTD